MYEDVLAFAKKTLKSKVKSTGGGGLQCTTQPPMTPSQIIYTTVKELAEKEMSLSKVREFFTFGMLEVKMFLFSATKVHEDGHKV